MAELDDKLLKNLDKTLESMNERLLTLETTLSGVKNGLNKTFDPSIITSFSDAIRGLKTLRLIDAEGAAKDIQKVKDKIDELEAKWKGDKPLGKGESFAGIADELARYKALMKDIQKGSEQRSVELANAAKKEADAVEAEERRKQREFQKTANEQAKLLKAYSDIEQARSVVTGGKKFGELDAEQTKKYKEFGRTLDELKKKMDDLEKTSPGSRAAGTQIFKEQEAVTKAKREAAEEQTRIKKEQAEQERQINEAIKEEERRRAAENKRMLDEEKKALADYIRLFSEKQSILKNVAPLDAKVIRNQPLTEQERGLYDASWNRINAINDDMAKLRSNYVSVLEYEEKIQANGQEQVALSKVRLTQEQALAKEKERQAKSELKQQSDEAKIQKQADAIVKKRIDLERQVQRIDNDRAIRQQTNSKIRQQALDAENAKYLALFQRIDLLDKALAKLEGKQAGVTARAEQRNAPYMNYVAAAEEERKAKAIENSTKKLKEQKNTLDSMLPTLQRLASAFGVAFSVRGLAQFGKKLIETRGEFEMQFVAMKQIIGDVDAATRIWNQTMQQALQSPFKAMQLVTYTKQLAAYRIETEKLFDTTKRLADISAGLGVDMGRLILAFGQVKSANFLRASEVRQFTEAGVNIVGNLAQYFTELEGRAVSTADVMERITKRMVMFSDVEEIFRRMTDEGGEFYKMQEVQANTVKGQIAKLHDAYDQMLNTIGQANQGTLRKYIESLNELVRNWRTVASFIMKNVNAMVVLVPLIATYRKGAKMAAGETFTWSRAMKQLELELAFGRAGIKKFSLSTALGTAAVYTFKGAVELTKMALRTFVPFIAIEGLMWLVTKMGEADRNAKELAKSLDEVGSKNAASLQENIDGFTDLVERLKQANEGSQDYLDIRNKIQSQYGEYLDNLELEQITVENLAKSYDKVVERMREKSRQHIMEEGLQEIADAYGDALVKFQKELKGTKLPNGMKVNDKEAADIAKKMYDLYSKDEFYRSDGSAGVLLGKTLRDYYGISGELNLSLKTAKDFQKAIESRYKSQIDLETKANALTKATSDTHKEYLDQLNAEEEHEKKIAEILADASIKSSGRRELAIQAEQLRYEEKKLELQAQYQKKSDEWLKNEKAKLKENYGAFLNAYNEQVKAYVGGRFGEGWMQGDNSDAWKAYNFMIANQDRLSQGQTKWEEKILNDKKLTEENIKRIKEQQSTQTAADSEAAKALNESLKQEEDRLELIKKQMELLGLHEKQKGGSGSANNSIYGERIRLLQDMLQKYKQLAKEAYGYAKAEGKVSESFEDAWNSIMPVGYGDLEVPTSYKALAEMLQRLEAFTPSFDKNGQLSKMLADLKKAVSDALSQVDIELSVRIRDDFGKQMEKAFGDYELTLELDKLNLPKGLAADMWGIEETDLEDLRKRLSQMYMGLRDENGQLSDEAFKDYEKFLNKIDDLERKQQRERLKDYAKYLEAQYSDRAKLEMDYVRRLSQLEAETAIPEQQKSDIRKGLEREFLEKSRKQDWEDFKGSEFYVGMMEDLEKQGSASLEVMRKKLLEMRENAENLSPRALKEVVNALEKIDELEKKRIPPLKRIREEQEKLKGIEIKDVYERIAANQEKLAQDEQEQKDLERMIMLEEERQKLEKQGITLEEAKAKLARSEQALSLILPSLDTSSDGSKEGEERRRILTETVNQAKKEVENWAEIVRILSGQATIDEQERGSRYGGLSLSDLKKRRDDAKQRIKDLEGVIGKDEKLVKAQKDLEDAWNDTWEAAKRWAQSINGIFDGVMDTIGYFSDSTSTLTAEWKEFGDTSISALTDLVSGIQAYQQANAAAQKAGLATGLFTANGLQLAMVVLGVIIKVVQAIAKLHDARIDKEIEQSKERVDDLQKAYERLEKQIEKTFDTVSYMMEFNKETQNLYEQIEEANRQIAAAQDYKSADKRKEAIEAAEEAKQQALDALDEIKQAQIEVFGGIGEDNYRSAAEGFVDAWKSAFLETGDGLQGLQEHFDEFLQDWFVKQATMQGVAKYYQKVFDYINGVVEDGSVPTRQEIENARLLADEAALKSDELMQYYASIFGLGGEGSLSGLAAGIQGMTEEQANILEAYWNSVRGYTASIDMNVATIVGLLSNGTSGGGGGKGNIFGDPNVETNPMLQQLSLIAANTQATHQLLQSVTKSGHSLGGAGIKVFVD